MSHTQNKRPITDNLSTVAVLVRGIPASVDRVSAECIWKADWADLGRDLFETVLLLFRSKVNISHVMSFIVFPCWKDERWWMHLIHRKHQNEGSLILGCLWLPMAQTALLDLRSFAFHGMFHLRPSATAGRPRLHGAMKPWSLDANRIDENNRYSMIQHDNEWYMNDIWMIQITSDNPGISMVSSGTERRFNLL